MSKRNLTEPLLAAVESVMSQLHVSLPGRVERYDHTTQRAEVKPLLRRNYADGEVEDMPVIAGVPVVFPRAGGASLTMPVNRGDGVMLVFADRSIDRWLAEGGEVTPDDRRKHDISDCIAIPGLYSFADASPQDNNEDVLLQYQGSEVRLTGAGDVDVTTGGDVTVNCTNATVNALQTTINSETSNNGNVTIDGNLTVSGDVEADGISLTTHVHGGVESGVDTSGGPQ